MKKLGVMQKETEINENCNKKMKEREKKFNKCQNSIQVLTFELSCKTKNIWVNNYISRPSVQNFLEWAFSI